MSTSPNLWIFNISDENWQQCVEGPAEDSLHQYTGPCQGVRFNSKVPVKALVPGDVVLARRTGTGNSGVAGIWEYEHKRDLGMNPEMSLWNDDDYGWILYCNPIQRELPTPLKENWQEIAKQINVSSVQKATGKIQGAVSKVDAGLAEYYIHQLLNHPATNEAARKRLKELKQQPDSQVLKEDIITEQAPYYWVNQTSNSDELTKGFLEASRSDNPHHDLQKLKEGDIVFNYTDGEIIGYSEVVRPPYLVEIEGEERRRVEVEMTRFEEPIAFADVFSYLRRDDVRLDSYYPINKAGLNQKYLFNLSRAAGEYLLEKGQTPNSNTARLQARLKLPDISVSLPDDLYFYGSEESYLRDQIDAALRAGKHIIFTGPPGTGKSRLAKAVADQAAELNQVDGHIFTTATAEWSSFDTIGGYVPSTTDSQLEFDPRLFLQCFRTDDGTIRNRWLVIDEMNRTNIDKALGPLFSVLSKDSVELPYERENRIQVDWIDEDTDELGTIAINPDRFPVTPAWRLLGTMNTFDKTSLYDLSFAFMRRFSFIHVGVPELWTDNDVVTRDLLDPDAGPNYGILWQRERPHLESTINNRHHEIAVLWAIINDYRTIGPAIILDIIEQIAAYQGGDKDAPLTSAVINYVFPQLEGLRQHDQKDLLQDLLTGAEIETKTGTASVELPLRMSYLRRKAEDIYDAEFDLEFED